MKRMRLAVVGLGKVGRACALNILDDGDLELAGIVRRRQHVSDRLSGPLRDVPLVSYVSELGSVDAALICVPSHVVAEVAREILQQHIAIVECAEFHGGAFESHTSLLGRLASRFGVPAMVGAGWDPGMLSLYRGLFALLIPRGESETTRRPGASLHHTTTARNIPGVRDALSAELRTPSGVVQHYVYVELADGASAQQVDRAVRADPLFLNQDTLVIPVESIAALEEQGHGIYFERRGVVSGDHQRFLLEGRFDVSTVTARVMVAAAKAVPFCDKGAHTLFEIPPMTLWGRAGPERVPHWI